MTSPRAVPTTAATTRRSVTTVAPAHDLGPEANDPDPELRTSPEGWDREAGRGVDHVRDREPGRGRGRRTAGQGRARGRCRTTGRPRAGRGLRR